MLILTTSNGRNFLATSSHNIHGPDRTSTMYIFGDGNNEIL